VFPAVRCIQFYKWNLHKTEIIALAVKATLPTDLSRYTLAYLLTPYQLHNTENLDDTMTLRQLYQGYDLAVLHCRQDSNWGCSEFENQ
jgi:hypothetical protein